MASPLNTLAQSPANEASTAGAASSAVLVANMDRIIRESQAGRSIQDQAGVLRADLHAKLRERHEALKQDERALAEQRGAINQAVFNARVTEFEALVQSLRRDEQTANARLQRALADASSALKKALTPILIEIMAEHSAEVMLDKQSVLFNAKALDVTDEAIARLDAALPAIEVTLPVLDRDER